MKDKKHVYLLLGLLKVSLQYFLFILVSKDGKLMVKKLIHAYLGKELKRS